jgi:hypothetical protein
MADTALAKHFAFYLLLLVPFTAAAKQAAPTPSDVHAEILQVYNFQPHALTHDQIQQKSTLLDQFWSKASSRPDVYVPALRQELANFNNPPFFLFDGSKLLLSLSKDPADRKIVLAAISHSDLRDLQLLDYFLLVQYMAAQGENTTAAAFHILEYPKFQVFIPQHVLTLAQNYSLIYMLIPTQQDFWIEPAIARLRTEKDETAQQSLLLLLWYAQTNDSDKAIDDFSKDPSKTALSRAYAKELAHRKDHLTQAAREAVRGANEQSLRDARRDRMKAVSDEALDDLDSYTLKIIALRQ